MSSHSLWSSPASFPTLHKHEIHIWQFSLFVNAEQTAHFFNLLSLDEKKRAQRFKFEKDRNAFIAGRGNLRTLLAKYLNCDPQTLQFVYNKYGKPAIAAAPQLQFNLSHSAGLGLLAVADDHAVGVDIETMKKPHDIENIAQRFFAERESKDLQTLTGTAKIQAFFKAWTCKEAFLKAYGQGLSFSLGKIVVDIFPEQPAAILALHDPALNLSDWFIQTLHPAADYAAAVVMQGKPNKVTLYEC